MTKYGRARESEPLRAHPLRTVINELGGAIARLECAKNLLVRCSLGQGNWATIPWVALLDPEVTDAVSRGVYVIFLFRADMSGVYLTLNQGTSEFGLNAGALYRSRAASLRQACSDLPARGFRLDHSIDLRSDAPTARSYTDATIAHRLYEAEAVPDDRVLADDVRSVCQAYARARRIRLD